MSSDSSDESVFLPEEPIVEESNTDDVGYTNCTIEQLPCYHESTSRNTAEALLLSANEGSFLIRSSSVPGNYSLSVSTTNAVRHFQIDYNGQWYSFGQAQFWSPLDMWEHLLDSPVLECDKGVTVRLLQPYFKEEESDKMAPEAAYSKVRKHWTEKPNIPTRRRSSNYITSLEGWLHKKKKGKTWKHRWCVLNQNFLSYKKTEKERKILTTLDLTKAVGVLEDKTEEPNRKNCFRIVFPTTYYIFSLDTPEDKEAWFKNIKWQIDATSEES